MRHSTGNQWDSRIRSSKLAMVCRNWFNTNRVIYSYLITIKREVNHFSFYLAKYNYIVLYAVFVTYPPFKIEPLRQDMYER